MCASPNIIGINLEKCTIHITISASTVLYGIVPYLYFFAMRHHDKHQHIDISLHGMVQYHMLGMFRGV